MLTDLLLTALNTMFGKSQPSPPDRSLATVVYSRQGCHLCDEAVQLLREHGLQPKIVDIDADSELASRFNCCVPVVEIEGRIRFRGRVNEVLLRRLTQKA